MRSVLLVLLVACTPSVEDRVSIQQGLYGELTVSSDVADEPDGVLRKVDITAYQWADAKTVIATVTSDTDGFYELALPPGTFIVCTYGNPAVSLYDQWQHNCAGACTRIDITHDRIRGDWASNQSGGLWTAGDHCPRT